MEAMAKLAAKYQIQNGQVDYLCCFREFLNDLAGTDNRKPLTKALPLPEVCHSREIRPSHPWHFHYTRDSSKSHENPYWRMVQSMGSLPVSEIEKKRAQSQPVVVPPPFKKSASLLTDTERNALISQYAHHVLVLCSRAFSIFLPNWKAMRNELLRLQVTNQRGTITAERFQDILEHYGVRMSKKDWSIMIRSFRGIGQLDVVKYDEFLRVCMLVKTSFLGK
jgi:hypothetical protein